MNWVRLFSTGAIELPPCFGSLPQTGEPTKRNETGFLDFYRATIPKAWTLPSHVRRIAEALDRVDRGEIDRLAIHMPPRHGKSETVTVRYPLKRLIEHPGENVLVTGYNERFARKFGRRTRNMALERGIVASDKTASDEWSTAQGGLYMARGVGSPPTGTGFSRIVVDDPIRRRMDAESEAYREACWDWYSEDLLTRLEPGGAIILVCTLWHHDDVAARAVAAEPGRWEVLKLPALDEHGDALWPERYDAEYFRRVRGVMGDHAFGALYQQEPTPREGAFYQTSKIRLFQVAPAGLRSVRAWDLGATQDDGDWTVGCKVEGPDESGIFHASFVRFRCEPSERNRRIRQTAELDGVGTEILIPQDPGAAGKEAAINLVRVLAGFQAKAKTISGDKQIRAEIGAAQVNAELVRFKDDEASRAALDVFRQFPLGKHDDDVDAFSDAITALCNTREFEWDF